MNDYVKLFGERYSTALLADAAYRAGVGVGVPPPVLLPLDPASKVAGPTVTVQANNDLVAILGAVHHAAAGSVIVVANELQTVGLMGDLIAAEAVRKGIAGVVVDGLVRDTAEIAALGLPVFCRGRIPVGPLKLPAALKGIGQRDVPVRLGDAEVRPGDWVFGDADGVIVLAADALATVFEGAEQAYRREEALLQAIEEGRALGDLLGIDAFLEKRAADSGADFNQHLLDMGRAI